MVMKSFQMETHGDVRVSDRWMDFPALLESTDVTLGPTSENGRLFGSGAAVNKSR